MLNEQTFTSLSLGQPAPGFTLPDLHGNLHSLSDYRGRLVVLNFWSAECPFSARADGLLSGWLDEWGGRVVMLPIAAEPQEQLWQAAQQRDLTLVLRDDCQRTADAYGALTTPHFFVVDRRGVLRYQGGLDDATFRQRTATRHYLREALEALMDGRPPHPAQTQPYGCTIVRYVDS